MGFECSKYCEHQSFCFYFAVLLTKIILFFLNTFSLNVYKRYCLLVILHMILTDLYFLLVSFSFLGIYKQLFALTMIYSSPEPAYRPCLLLKMSQLERENLYLQIPNLQKLGDYRIQVTSFFLRNLGCGMKL